MPRLAQSESVAEVPRRKIATKISNANGCKEMVKKQITKLCAALTFTLSLTLFSVVLGSLSI
jgi:hypothetical protein